jgi:hypothetical protein
MNANRNARYRTASQSIYTLGCDCSCVTSRRMLMRAIKSQWIAALSLESVDDVHGRDGLAAGVLGVGDGIADDVLQEHLEDTAGLLVDQARGTLDTTTSSQTTDGGPGDALNVVTQNLAVTLGSICSRSEWSSKQGER